MRIFLAAVLLALPLPRLWACLCDGPGTPCYAAGRADAAFTGTVLDFTAHLARPIPGGISPRLVEPGFVVIRMRVGEVLSGVAPGQREIELVSGGDCGYPFQQGVEYVVYAVRDAEGRLTTSICAGTQPLAQAARDLEYFHAKAGAPETSELRVGTGQPGVPGKANARIVAERAGSRYLATTNGAGEALFPSLPAGQYAIHAEADGDLPDDPKIHLGAKGCGGLTLFRFLRITGRVTTKAGAPAARVEVELRKESGPDDGTMTGPDGQYQLRIARPGRYYLGVNLNHTATGDTPYPRWFYPGTADAAQAAIIEFSGKPSVRTCDFALPDRVNGRVIEGVVLTRDGQPRVQGNVSVVDASQTVVAYTLADRDGRFVLHLFAGIAYRLHATWAGDTPPGSALSAVPVDIPPEGGPLSLRLVLDQPGNSVLQERGKR